MNQAQVYATWFTNLRGTMEHRAVSIDVLHSGFFESYKEVMTSTNQMRMVLAQGDSNDVEVNSVIQTLGDNLDRSLRNAIQDSCVRNLCCPAGTLPFVAPQRRMWHIQHVARQMASAGQPSAVGPHDHSQSEPRSSYGPAFYGMSPRDCCAALGHWLDDEIADNLFDMYGHGRQKACAETQRNYLMGQRLEVQAVLMWAGSYRKDTFPQAAIGAYGKRGGDD